MCFKDISLEEIFFTLGRSAAPRSYCATSWEGSKSIACNKLTNQSDDQECVCQQDFCNWPYDPLTTMATTPAVGPTTLAPTTMMPVQTNTTMSVVTTTALIATTQSRLFLSQTFIQ